MTKAWAFLLTTSFQNVLLVDKHPGQVQNKQLLLDVLDI